MYGLDTKENNDDIMECIEDGLVGTREILVTGGFLVDYIPILQYAPLWMAPFKRRFKKWREAFLHMKRLPFERYKERVAQEGEVDCAVDGMLTSKSEGKEPGEFRNREELARQVAGVVFAGESNLDNSLVYRESLTSCLVNSGVGYCKYRCLCFL